jgi:hypothetical protein
MWALYRLSIEVLKNYVFSIVSPLFGSFWAEIGSTELGVLTLDRKEIE